VDPFGRGEAIFRYDSVLLSVEITSFMEMVKHTKSKIVDMATLSKPLTWWLRYSALDCLGLSNW